MITKRNGTEDRLPEFLIAGAAKSGTTSLYNYLNQHPQVFLTDNKEPCFFSFPESTGKYEKEFGGNLNIVSDFSRYLFLFKNALDTQITGEASTCYLYLYKETIENIKKYHPYWEGLKIIIVIRNPIERAISHYVNDARCHAFDMTFDEAVEKYKRNQLSTFSHYIDYGLYYNQIKSYKENFVQMKILLFDDLKECASTAVKEVFKFLCVDSSFCSDTTLEYNVSPGIENNLLNSLIYKPNILKSTVKKLLKKEVRTRLRNKVVRKKRNSGKIGNASREYLNELYKDDILKLQDLIDRDLTPWLSAD